MPKEKTELKIKNISFNQKIPVEEKRKQLFKVFDVLLCDDKQPEENENLNNKS